LLNLDINVYEEYLMNADKVDREFLIYRLSYSAIPTAVERLRLLISSDIGIWRVASLYMDRIDWGSSFVSEPKMRKSLSEDGIDQTGFSPFFVNKTTFSSLRGC